MHYPGNERYDAVLARLRAGVRSYDEIAAIMDEIQAALDAGVPFEMSLALVDTYVDAVEEVIDGLRFIDLPAGWALAQYRTIAQGTMGRWLRMLAPEPQLRAQRLLDALYARAVYELSGEASLAAAERFVAEHPIPAPAVCAVALWQANLLEESVAAGERALPLIEVVNTSSTEAIDLLIAAQSEFHSGVHFARVLADQEPRGRRQILNLLAFEDELNAAFGYMFAKKESLLFARKKRLADQETRQAFELKLIELVDGWGATAYAKRFKDYLMGRICAAHSDWGRATKLFRKALKGGFCEYKAVSQLAFILKTRKKHAQVRELLEEYADRWLVARGPDSHFARGARAGRDLGSIYAEAGGDPTTIGLVDPHRRFEDAAAANAPRMQQVATQLAKPRAEAVAAFWADCRARIVRALGDLVEARDLDAAVLGMRSPRGVTFDAHLAARTHLDEVPDLAPVPRDVLLAATEAPVSGEVLGRAFLTWLDHDAMTTGHRSQIDRFTSVAGAAALARRRVLAASDLATARALVDTYQQAGALAADAVVALQLEVVNRCDAAAEQVSEAQRFLARDEHIPAATREPLREALVAGALTQLRGVAAAADARSVLQTIAQWATPAEARAPVRIWWDGWAGARPPDERMQIAAALDPALRDPQISAAGVDAALAVIDRAAISLQIEDPLRVAKRLATDARPDEAVAQWYARGAETSADDDLEQAIDVGVWLIGELEGPPATMVTSTMRGLMERRLATATGLAARRQAIDELLEQFPDDPGLVQIADAQRAAERKRRFTIVGAVAAAVAVAALVIALT